MLKNNYRKIEKKKDNDMDADVAQCEHSNIKRYASTFSNILINHAINYLNTISWINHAIIY